jgi:hypothetical protein
MYAAGGYASSSSNYSASSGGSSFRSDGSEISPRSFEEAEHAVYGLDLPTQKAAPSFSLPHPPAGPPPLAPWAWPAQTVRAKAFGAAALPAEQSSWAAPAPVRTGGSSSAAPAAAQDDALSMVRHNRREDIAELLARGAVHVDMRDAHGNTLLAVACQNGLKRMCKLLLRQGSDINSRNTHGQTPLGCAFAYGYDELGEYLASKGAVVDDE